MNISGKNYVFFKSTWHVGALGDLDYTRRAVWRSFIFFSTLFFNYVWILVNIDFISATNRANKSHILTTKTWVHSERADSRRYAQTEFVCQSAAKRTEQTLLQWKTAFHLTQIVYTGCVQCGEMIMFFDGWCQSVYRKAAKSQYIFASENVNDTTALFNVHLYNSYTHHKLFRVWGWWWAAPNTHKSLH